MSYYVYILASDRYGTLYIGVTNNLRARLEQHRLGVGSKFAKTWRLSIGLPRDHLRQSQTIKKIV